MERGCSGQLDELTLEEAQKRSIFLRFWVHIKGSILGQTLKKARLFWAILQNITAHFSKKAPLVGEFNRPKNANRRVPAFDANQPFYFFGERIKVNGNRADNKSAKGEALKLELYGFFLWRIIVDASKREFILGF